MADGTRVEDRMQRRKTSLGEAASMSSTLMAQSKKGSPNGKLVPDVKGKAKELPQAAVGAIEEDNALLDLADAITARAHVLVPGKADLDLARRAHQVVKATFDRGESRASACVMPTLNATSDQRSRPRRLRSRTSRPFFRPCPQLRPPPLVPPRKHPSPSSRMRSSSRRRHSRNSPRTAWTPR